MAHNRQHNTGRFMSEDMWNEKIPDRPYMTDTQGNQIDSRSDAGQTPLQQASTGWPTDEGQGYEEPRPRDTNLGQKISESQTLGGTSNPSGRFGSLGRSGSSGGYGKKRVAEDSRGQANLTGKKRSSLLTS